MLDKKSNLLWLDIETTGMDLFKDRILEMAFIVTDKNLNILWEKEFVIHQNDEILEKMGEWCQQHHSESGLIERVKNSKLNEQVVEAEMLQIAEEYFEKETSPLCGNTVHFDRYFLKKYLKEFEAFLHYRNIDVSSIKELYKRWHEGEERFQKKKAHRAMDDIKESINELKFYRERFLK